jgi:hypothetical protein
MIVAFFCATQLAGLIICKLSPYFLFGIKTVNEESIKMVTNQRGLIEFSNGVALKGIKLLPFDLIWAVMSLTFTFGLWVCLMKMAVFLLAGIKPDVANALIELREQIRQKGSNKPKS